MSSGSCRGIDALRAELDQELRGDWAAAGSTLFPALIAVDYPRRYQQAEIAFDWCEDEGG